jgi:VanZ family protein
MDSLKSKKRTRLIAFLWLLVIAVAAMIFFFSAQSGDESSKTSTGLAVFFLNLAVPGFDGLTAAEKAVYFDKISLFVRKAAHFTEFAMLGASLRLLFHALSLQRPVLIAWAAGTLYACTDELHQMFVDGRGAMWQDVCIDSAGVLTAVLLVTLWLRWREKRKMKKG